MKEPTLQERRLDKYPAPDFAGNLALLEARARDGVDTYTGPRRLEFRMGMEVEFNPLFAKDALGFGDGFREVLLNPQLLDSARPDESTQEAVLCHKKVQAQQLIESLVPIDEEQAARKDQWLAQIEDFGVFELINFELYSEFSTPTLSVPDLTQAKNLSELDATANSNKDDRKNWLEFRFGTDKGGQGYYDAPRCCEIRLSPCAPSELTSRYKAVNARLIEIANRYGVVLATDKYNKSGAHLNMSVYDLEDDGSPVVKSGEDDATKVLVGGIVQGYSDGLNLPYMDSGVVKRLNPISVGNNRGYNIVIKDGMVENRALFFDVDSGINWMVSGALFGLIVGPQGIDSGNLPSLKLVDDIEVVDGHEIENYDAIRFALEVSFIDTVIQRMKLREGYFNRDLFGNCIDLFNQLFRRSQDSNVVTMDRSGEQYHNIMISNNLLFGSLKINTSNGRPYIDLPDLKRLIAGLPSNLGDPKEVQEFMTEGAELDAVVGSLNLLLRHFRYTPSRGYVNCSYVDYANQGELKAAIKNSDVLPLFSADDPRAKQYIAWLETRRSEFV